jgi:hypothetical protein
LTSILIGLPLALGLGLEPGDLVLLGLTFIVASITFRSRRIQPLQGAVHLVIFCRLPAPDSCQVTRFTTSGDPMRWESSQTCLRNPKLNTAEAGRCEEAHVVRRPV